jgi:hypothetical protein
MMKKEYDFSEGKRGKFFRDDISLQLPIFLEPKNLAFIQSVAEKNKSDISTVINDLIKKNLLEKV